MKWAFCRKIALRVGIVFFFYCPRQMHGQGLGESWDFQDKLDAMRAAAARDRAAEERQAEMQQAQDQEEARLQAEREAAAKEREEQRRIAEENGRNERATNLADKALNAVDSFLSDFAGASASMPSSTKGSDQGNAFDLLGLNPGAPGNVLGDGTPPSPADRQEIANGQAQQASDFSHADAAATAQQDALNALNQRYMEFRALGLADSTQNPNNVSWEQKQQIVNQLEAQTNATLAASGRTSAPVQTSPPDPSTLPVSKLFPLPPQPNSSTPALNPNSVFNLDRP